MFDNGVKSIEIMFDLDYMVDKYETDTGTTYNPLDDITLSNYGYIYYRQLKDNMIPYLKEVKNQICEELYIFITYSQGAIKYNEAGDLGVIHNFTLNFLIDEDTEVEDLVNTLAEGTLRGTFDIYINHTVLDVHSHINYMHRVHELFDSLLVDKDISISFDLVKAEYTYDKKDGQELKAAIYTMTIEDKTT